MKKTIIAAIAFSLLYFSIIGFAKEHPETITVIYLKDGQIIKCDMGWEDGDTLYYRKYDGTIGILLKRVDINRTYNKAIEKEKKVKEKIQRLGEKSKFGDIEILNYRVNVKRKKRRGGWEKTSIFYKYSCSVRNLGPVLSSFLCKFFIFQFFEERQVVTHFSYRV